MDCIKKKNPVQNCTTISKILILDSLTVTRTASVKKQHIFQFNELFHFKYFFIVMRIEKRICLFLQLQSTVVCHTCISVFSLYY